MVLSGGVLGLRVMLGEGETPGDTAGEREGLLASGDGASKISGLGEAASKSCGSICILG